ncbi:hypothetical protein tb265_06420 [Gemmatimonadetes bacterium T265]|nr:hypothetical protein tb265_06420 [Gemmatimonadetes bacterium T265]
MPSASPRDSAAPPATPEAGRTRWVELSAALTAVVVSVGSLLIARHQAEVMDRQLAASVWPLVEFDTSNEGDDGKPRLALTLHNSGVGPTRVRSVRLAYKGRPMRGAVELLRTCCLAAVDTAHSVTTSTSDVTGRVLTAGRSVDFLVLPPDTGQRALFSAFNRERFAVTLRVCYCSVLEDCWVVESDGHGGAEPAPVASCAAERKATQYR